MTPKAAIYPLTLLIIWQVNIILLAGKVINKVAHSCATLSVT